MLLLNIPPFRSAPIFFTCGPHSLPYHFIRSNISFSPVFIYILIKGALTYKVTIN